MPIGFSSCRQGKDKPGYLQPLADLGCDRGEPRLPHFFFFNFLIYIYIFFKIILYIIYIKIILWKIIIKDKIKNFNRDINL